MKIGLLRKITSLAGLGILALTIVILAGIGLYGLLAGSRTCISNRLMTCVKAGGERIFILNFTPEKRPFARWFDENKPVVLSSSEQDSKSYKIIYSGSYEVSTTRGTVAAFFTILQSEKDKRLYFSRNDRFETMLVVHKRTTPLPTGVEGPHKITCHPVVINEIPEVIERAQEYIFDSLQNVK